MVGIAIVARGSIVGTDGGLGIGADGDAIGATLTAGVATGRVIAGSGVRAIVGSAGTTDTRGAIVASCAARVAVGVAGASEPTLPVRGVPLHATQRTVIRATLTALTVSV
jgi:hypothetical protein